MRGRKLLGVVRIVFFFDGFVMNISAEARGSVSNGVRCCNGLFIKRDW